MAISAYMNPSNNTKSAGQSVNSSRPAVLNMAKQSFYRALLDDGSKSGIWLRPACLSKFNNQLINIEESDDYDTWVQSSTNTDNMSQLEAEIELLEFSIKLRVNDYRVSAPEDRTNKWRAMQDELTAGSMQLGKLRAARRDLASRDTDNGISQLLVLEKDSAHMCGTHLSACEDLEHGSRQEGKRDYCALEQSRRRILKDQIHKELLECVEQKRLDEEFWSRVTIKSEDMVEVRRRIQIYEAQWAELEAKRQEEKVAEYKARREARLKAKHPEYLATFNAWRQREAERKAKEEEERKHREFMARAVESCEALCLVLDKLQAAGPYDEWKKDFDAALELKGGCELAEVELDSVEVEA